MDTKRTPDELTNPDFNYFLAYNIAPTEKDAKKIEASMAQRKNTFTQGTPVQRRLMNLYGEAVLIMTEKTSRDQEYQNAKRLKMDSAKSAIVVIAEGRGAIYKRELKKMADASQKWFTAGEIEKEAISIGVKVFDDTKKTLDFHTFEKVEKLLKIIGKPDLYELLGNPSIASPATLQSAMITLYNSVSGKTDPKSTATNQICGEIKKIFKDATSKKYYDIYLATKDIWVGFEFRRSNGISEIYAVEYSKYLKDAVSAMRPLGIFTDVEIKNLLRDGLKYYHISIVEDDLPEVVEDDLPEVVEDDLPEVVEDDLPEIEIPPQSTTPSPNNPKPTINSNNYRIWIMIFLFFLIVFGLGLWLSKCSSNINHPSPSKTKIYKIGDAGPAGGHIFYDKGKHTDGWRYLEAAPVSSEKGAKWGLVGFACPGTSTGIGSGRANTAAIIKMLTANNQTGTAAQICASLNINGFNDWFLPSKDELNEMYLRLRVGNNVGGFDTGGRYPKGWYWSSSAESDNSIYWTWVQRFSDGYQDVFIRSDALSVRAVRAF